MTDETPAARNLDTACPECGCRNTQYVGLDDITGEIRRQCVECGDVFYPSDTAPAPREAASSREDADLR